MLFGIPAIMSSKRPLLSAGLSINNYGTLVNGALYAADVPSPLSSYINSVAFDGVDDRMNLVRPVYLNPTNSAISYWFKVNNTGGGNHFILASGVEGDYAVQWESGNFYMTYRVGGSAYAAYSLSTATWYHFVLNRKDGITQFYVNGSPLTMISQSTTGSYELSLDTFGLYSANPTSGHQLNGNISDPRVYADVLSDADIAALYAGGNAAITPLHWWKMNEGVGIIATDYGIYDADADAFMQASRSVGDIIHSEDEYTFHELLSNLKSGQLVS